MNIFKMLVIFECKKIFMRKSTYFAFAIMLTVCTIAMLTRTFGNVYYDGEKAGSKLSVLYSDREAQHGVAGYFNNLKIREAIGNYAYVRDTTQFNNIRYTDALYKEKMQPYMVMQFALMNVISTDIRRNETEFGKLNGDSSFNFYSLRTKQIIERLTQDFASKEEINIINSENAALNIPFYYDYFEGYKVFIQNITPSALFIILAIAICIAPIFCGEYSTKMDQLILTSKHGKNRVILAKIFAGMVFALGSMFLSLLAAAIAVFSVYGIMGYNVSFQFFNLFSVYPLTMLGAVIILCVVILFVTMLMSTIILFLSAKFRSAFSVIISVTVVIFGSLFISLPIQNSILNDLNYILPAKMLDSDYVFSIRYVSLFGQFMKPYIFIPMVCVISTIILIPLTYSTFKKHQISY